ncbi:hypothetical protein CEUSTIGMA_g8981.t1 [Chlamydomonas eustigma]|uniref:Uncharacterized protein n=1 Tax=Chlamydomonas eustigma TaxID=1157962 RepID=A0A250XES1_9CHLO|nr:hypothetical protein CEUSTIGMA_g8981.t1 [Chlamydomonas eustigma]|eukprot:GAX81553.1 hypothetical protein CEUSTIGMA_g8981.t1 [Chlamydomonas eustigma]
MYPHLQIFNNVLLQDVFFDRLSEWIPTNCLVDLIDESGCLGHPDFYISHDWDAGLSVGELLDAVEQYLTALEGSGSLQLSAREDDLNATRACCCVWLDWACSAFCHAEGGLELNMEVGKRLEGIISKCPGGTLVVCHLQSNTRPVLSLRSLCEWESTLRSHHSMSGLHFLIPRGARQQQELQLIINAVDIDDAVCRSLSCSPGKQHLQSGSPEDEGVLALKEHLVRNKHGSSAAFNAFLRLSLLLRPDPGCFLTHEHQSLGSILDTTQSPESLQAHGHCLCCDDHPVAVNAVKTWMMIGAAAAAAAAGGRRGSSSSSSQVPAASVPGSTTFIHQQASSNYPLMATNAAAAPTGSSCGTCLDEAVTQECPGPTTERHTCGHEAESVPPPVARLSLEAGRALCVTSSCSSTVDGSTNRASSPACISAAVPCSRRAACGQIMKAVHRPSQPPASCCLALKAMWHIRNDLQRWQSGQAESKQEHDNDRDSSQGHQLPLLPLVYQETPPLVCAFLFISEQDKRSSEPLGMIKSIAYQLAQRLPTLREYLLNELTVEDVEALSKTSSFNLEFAFDKLLRPLLKTTIASTLALSESSLTSSHNTACFTKAATESRSPSVNFRQQHQVAGSAAKPDDLAAPAPAVAHLASSQTPPRPQVIIVIDGLDQGGDIPLACGSSCCSCYLQQNGLCGGHFSKYHRAVLSHQDVVLPAVQTGTSSCCCAMTHHCNISNVPLQLFLSCLVDRLSPDSVRFILGLTASNTDYYQDDIHATRRDMQELLKKSLKGSISFLEVKKTSTSSGNPQGGVQRVQDEGDEPPHDAQPLGLEINLQSAFKLVQVLRVAQEPSPVLLLNDMGLSSCLHALLKVMPEIFDTHHAAADIIMQEKQLKAELLGALTHVQLKQEGSLPPGWLQKLHSVMAVCENTSSTQAKGLQPTRPLSEDPSRDINVNAEGQQADPLSLLCCSDFTLPDSGEGFTLPDSGEGHWVLGAHLARKMISTTALQRCSKESSSKWVHQYQATSTVWEYGMRYCWYHLLSSESHYPEALVLLEQLLGSWDIIRDIFQSGHGRRLLRTLSHHFIHSTLLEAADHHHSSHDALPEASAIAKSLTAAEKMGETSDATSILKELNMTSTLHVVDSEMPGTPGSPSRPHIRSWTATAYMWDALRWLMSCHAAFEKSGVCDMELITLKACPAHSLKYKEAVQRCRDAKEGSSLHDSMKQQAKMVTSHILGGSMGEWSPQLLVLKGHNDAIWDAVYSSDGRLIATGSADCTVRVWEAVSGHCLLTLKTLQGGRVGSISFSPDGRYLAAACESQGVKVWDLSSGQLVSELRVAEGSAGAVTSAVAFSPVCQKCRTKDHRKCNIAEEGGVEDGVRIGEVHTSHDSAAECGAGGSCELLLISGAEDGHIRVWFFNPLAQSSIKELECCAPNTPGTEGGGQTATQRGTEGGGQTATHRGCVESALNNDHCTPPLRCCVTVLAAHRNKVTSVNFSADGQLLVSTSTDSTAKVWSVNTILRRGSRSTCEELASSVNAVSSALSRATASSPEPSNTQVVVTTPLATLTGHYDRVWGAAFSGDSKTVVTAGGDGTAKVWMCQQRDVVHNGTHSEQTTNDGDLSPQCCQSSALQPWLCVATLSGHKECVWGVSMSRDGTLVATTSGDHTARLWQVQYEQIPQCTAAAAQDYPAVQRWHCVSKLETHISRVTSVAFSPDEQMLVTAGGDHTARVWMVTPPALVTLVSPALGATLTTGPSGRPPTPPASLLHTSSSSGPGTAVTGSSGRPSTPPASLLYTSSSSCVGGGHTYAVTCLAFTPDGGMLASGSDDQTVRIWCCRTGR